MPIQDKTAGPHNMAKKRMQYGVTRFRAVRETAPGRSGQYLLIRTNVEEIKQYNKSELLCSTIIDPPQHATINAKTDNGASNNYWITEEMKILTNVKKPWMNQQSNLQTMKH